MRIGENNGYSTTKNYTTLYTENRDRRTQNRTDHHRGSCFTDFNPNWSETKVVLCGVNTLSARIVEWVKKMPTYIEKKYAVCLLGEIERATTLLSRRRRPLW